MLSHRSEKPSIQLCSLVNKPKKLTKGIGNRIFITGRDKQSRQENKSAYSTLPERRMRRESFWMRELQRAFNFRCRWGKVVLSVAVRSVFTADDTIPSLLYELVRQPAKTLSFDCEGSLSLTAVRQAIVLRQPLVTPRDIKRVMKSQNRAFLLLSDFTMVALSIFNTINEGFMA